MVLVPLLFIHLVVVDWFIVITLYTMCQWGKRIYYKDFIINARILTKSPRREHITYYIGSKVIIINKILMLSYKSYYNIAPSYLCQLIRKKGSHVNTHLGTDHHQLIMPPISKDCSFIYAAPCEWKKLSEHIRTLHFNWLFQEEC